MSLRISFCIDVKNSKITFYIERGKLEEWVKTAIKKYPKMDVTKKGTELLTWTMAKATEEVCERNKVKDWEKLKPNFVLYKSEAEIPRELKELKIT